RGLHVEDNLGPRVAPEEVAREQDQDEVGPVAPATLVDDAHAVGVAVVRDAEVGAGLDDLRLEIHDVGGVFGVGQVIGKAAVGLAVELDDLAADAPKELGRVEPRDAVAGVQDRKSTRLNSSHVSISYA